MGSKGIKEADLSRLEEGLKDLTDLHKDLSEKYSLRFDLIELNDRRHSLQKQLESELDKIKGVQSSLSAEVNSTIEIKEKLEKALNSFTEIEAILLKDESGDSRYSDILDITDSSNLIELKDKVAKIKGAYDELYSFTDETDSKISQLNNDISLYKEFHKKFFKDKNDDGENKVSEMERIYHALSANYNEWFVAGDEDSKNKKEQTEYYLNRIKSFHDKIYGDESKNISSLKVELDERLVNLGKVEARAKSVIGLSSEAGLAGGFVLKAKDARKGQYVSITIFIVIVLVIFGFNIFLFDKADFVNMNWDTFIFKLFINAPLIWIATIANVNLNRFSRLEQEYSHKEALAKSYERYKSEIQELETLGVDGSEELKINLLEINLNAFRVNPAEYSDKARSDFSILDAISGKKKDAEPSGE